MPGEGSFLARCALKFSEVLAAGVATALSGYMVAHFTGYITGPTLSAPQPAAMQAPVGPHPATNVSVKSPALPRAGSVNDAAPRRVPKPEARLVEPTPVAPAPPKVSPTKSKPARLSAAESVPGGAAARRPQNAADRKPDTAESLEARVRAALARSGRTAPSDLLHRQIERSSVTANAVPNDVRNLEARAAAAGVSAAPTEAAPGSVASTPPAILPQRIEIAPQPSEAPAQPIPPNPAAITPVRQTPGGQNPAGQDSAVQLPPLATVEVKPQPSIGAGSPQPTPPATDAQAPHQDQDSGPFSGFARMLRSDRPLPEDQAPRPPIAVGQ